MPLDPAATGKVSGQSSSRDLLAPAFEEFLLCAPDRNLKTLVIENSIVAGSPLSKLTPARESAQIISRE